MNRLWLFLLFILLQITILFPETDSRSQIYMINTKTTAVTSLIEGSPVVFTLDSSIQVILLKKVGQWGQVTLFDSPSKTGFVMLKILSEINQDDQKAFITSHDESAQQSSSFNDGFSTCKKQKQSFLITAIAVLLFAFLLLSAWKVFPRKATKLEPRVEAEGSKPNQLTNALKKPDPTKWVSIDPICVKPEICPIEPTKLPVTKQATETPPAQLKTPQETSASGNKAIPEKAIVPTISTVETSPKPPNEKTAPEPESNKTEKAPFVDRSDKQAKATEISPDNFKTPSLGNTLEKTPQCDSSSKSQPEDDSRIIKKPEQKTLEKPAEAKRNDEACDKSGQDNQTTDKIHGRVDSHSKEKLTEFDLNRYGRIEDTIQMLPEYLNKILFDEFKADYKPLNSRYKDPTTGNELRNYLGTYFPRSFVETKNIIYELSRTKTVQQILSGKSQLNILDLGAGTGGNLIGLLDFLNSVNCLPGKIIVTSIDGLGEALECQEKILIKIEKQFSIEIEFKKMLKMYDSKIDFSDHISQIPKNSEQYDFIITSKFINSLYKSAKNGEYDGTYWEFCKYIENKLSKDGLAICVENVDKANEEYFPITMNREVNEYISTSSNLCYLLPLSCALHSKTCKEPVCYFNKNFRIIQANGLNDSSNVTFNVFSLKQVADNYCSELAKNDKYRFDWGDNKYQYPNCCDKGERIFPKQEQLQNIPDAFLLNGQLKS